MKTKKLNHIFLFLVGLFFLGGVKEMNAQGTNLNTSDQSSELKCDFTKYAPIKMEHFPSEVVLKKVSPIYPKKAKNQKIEGAVSVKILINERGLVEKACAFYGEKIFWSKAEEAALKWRFKPKYGLAFKVQRQDKARKRYALAYISFTFKFTE